MVHNWQQNYWRTKIMVWVVTSDQKLRIFQRTFIPSNHYLHLMVLYHVNQGILRHQDTWIRFVIAWPLTTPDPALITYIQSYLSQIHSVVTKCLKQFCNEVLGRNYYRRNRVLYALCGSRKYRNVVIVGDGGVEWIKQVCFVSWTRGVPSLSVSW